MKRHFPPLLLAALLAALPAALISDRACAAETAPPGAAIGATAQVLASRAAAPATQPDAGTQTGTQTGTQAGATAGAQPAQAPVAPSVAAPRVETPAAAPAVSAASAAPGSAASLLQVIFGLLLVLGLLAAALWALKRFGGVRMAAGAPLKIIGGISVGNREKVLVLEVGDQWLVVGVAPGRVSMLTSMPRGEQRAADMQRPAPDFGAWLKQTLEKRNVK